MMRLIYIAIPYEENTVDNTEFIERACRHVMECGCAFFVPALSCFSLFADIEPTEEKRIIAVGHTILGKCDELWLFGRYISAKMRAAEYEAVRMGLPVRRVRLPFEPGCSEYRKSV